MRKRIYLCLIALVALLAGVTFSACDQHRWKKGDKSIEETVDSLVRLNLEDIANPVFTGVDEVIVYREIDADTKAVDSVFTTLPREVISKVATVLLNKHGTTTKKDIVNEYNAHRDIYNNLQPVPISEQQSPKEQASISLVKEEKTTVTEAPPTRVHISSKDTTIGGKRATVTTKVEQYE